MARKYVKCKLPTDEDYSYAYLYEAEGPALEEINNTSVKFCLKCKLPFLSSHRFNRICDKCKEKSNYSLDTFTDMQYIDFI